MKKLIIFTGIILSFFSLFITSCDIDIVDSEYRPAPSVGTQENYITVTFDKISTSTKRITVYRYNTASGTPGNTDKGVNIGFVLPQNNPDASAYTFHDTYAKAGRDYCYRIRYYSADDNYVYSKWSKEITVDSTNGITYDLMLADNTIDYNSTTNIVTLANAIEWNTDSQADTVKDDFTGIYLSLRCYEPQTSNLLYSCLVPLSASQVSASETINMRAILPSAYFDNEVEILGFVGVKTNTIELDDEDVPYYYNFTEPSSISSNAERINISSTSGNGELDYL